MGNLTASEIKLRTQQHEQDFFARCRRIDLILNRSVSKNILKIMTNLGPILNLVELNIIVNRLK